MPVEKRNPIPVGEAIERVVSQNIYMDEATVPLDASLNHILAEDIIATYEIPRFNKSPYDGFAIRSKDTTNASGAHRLTFNVIDHIGAGAVSDKKVGAFEAVRIMTGAAMPEGADAVVMLEQTVEQGQSFTLRKAFKPNENVSLKGEETQIGDVILQKGQQINPGAIAVLATYGYAQVPVFKKPSVAVIATGSELLDVSDDLEPGKIRNSNGPMITALASKLDLQVKRYQIQQDDLESSIQVVPHSAHRCLIRNDAGEGKDAFREEPAHGFRPRPGQRRRCRSRHRRQQSRPSPRRARLDRYRPGRQGSAAEPGRFDRARLELHLPRRSLA